MKTFISSSSWLVYMAKDLAARPAHIAPAVGVTTVLQHYNRLCRAEQQSALCEFDVRAYVPHSGMQHLPGMCVVCCVS